MRKGVDCMTSKSPFGDFRNTMNEFLHARPVKGFLQSMDEFFQTPFSTFPVYVKETDDSHFITAELPGIKREQITIDALDRTIHILVKNSETITEEDELRNIYRKSQSVQQMSRKIYLGYPINEKRIKATYQNGLLKITIAKPKGKKIELINE